MGAKLQGILLAALFVVGAFFSVYKLTESPPTWIDEGIVTQVARNVAESGKYAARVAPEEFVSAGFVTTGPSVILPVALSLRLFGSSLLVARATMVLYIVLLLIVAYLLVLKLWPEMSLWALALVVTFPPLYGLGRNVLGEIPGTALLLLGLLLLSNKKYWPYALLALGFAMAAKPLFLIFALPAIVIGFAMHQSELLNRKDLGIFAICLLAPLLLWAFLQFHGESVRDVISMYSGNPEGIPIFKLIWSNLERVVREPQVSYACLLSVAVVFGYYLRRCRGGVSMPETILVLCVVFGTLSYFKSRGYYRYFAPTEIMALVYLPIALSQFLNRKTSYLVFIALVAFQFYQTMFVAWVPEHYGSGKNSTIIKEMKDINLAPILFWQTPELVALYPGKSYYQYIKFADNIVRGADESSQALRLRIPEAVIVPTDLVVNVPLSDGYARYADFDMYTIFKRK